MRQFTGTVKNGHHVYLMGNDILVDGKVFAKYPNRTLAFDAYRKVLKFR